MMGFDCIHNGRWESRATGGAAGAVLSGVALYRAGQLRVRLK